MEFEKGTRDSPRENEEMSPPIEIPFDPFPHSLLSQFLLGRCGEGCHQGVR